MYTNPNKSLELATLQRNLASMGAKTGTKCGRTRKRRKSRSASVYKVILLKSQFLDAFSHVYKKCPFYHPSNHYPVSQTVQSQLNLIIKNTSFYRNQNVDG